MKQDSKIDKLYEAIKLCEIHIELMNILFLFRRLLMD